MASQQEPYHTPEQYLAFERDAEGKHEYIDGRIYAMTGARLSHVRIAANVGALLHAQLRGRPCEAFGSDLRVRVRESGMYTYPDVSAVCGEARFESDILDVLLNPSVIVEVLSPSTERYDRGEKFQRYQRLPSLREYVLFAQDHMRAEAYARDADDGTRWVLTVATGPDATIALPSIGCTLRLADVYERVELPPDPPVRAVYEDAPAARYAIELPVR